MYTIGTFLLILLNIAQWVIIIQVILSWLVNFNVLNMSQPLVYQIYSGLNAITEPVYRRIRRFIPSAGGLDFAPLVALLAIILLEIFIGNNLMSRGVRIG